MEKFKTAKEAILYEDEILFAFLAKHSIAEGHTIVALKKEVSDLSKLQDRDYDYLMDTVFAVRNALMLSLKVKKVYLVYMDETKQVHWHLIPRYEEKGFDAFKKEQQIVEDFSLAEKIKKNIKFIKDPRF
ncbi:MAG: HIT family protein [Candidatus Staskawiczbacteria bacterium]|nr:HIT family protein [Candidatus Staskawiczbacteria bacterium]